MEKSIAPLTTGPAVRRDVRQSAQSADEDDVMGLSRKLGAGMDLAGSLVPQPAIVVPQRSPEDDVRGCGGLAGSVDGAPITSRPITLPGIVLPQREIGEEIATRRPIVR
jgi:hypothetical protein